jgi:hypothetical protein
MGPKWSRMQLEVRAVEGQGGWEVEEERLERGEMWRNPPKALGMVIC